MMLTLLALLAAASAGAPAPVTQVQTLRCGAADLRMTSHTLAGPTAPLAPVDQKLTRRVGASQLPVALEPTASVAVQGGRVSNRYVASWACVAGERQAHYVLLGYACADDPGGRQDCGGEKEWFRLLDGRGRFVDAGVPHDGAARDRLNARLRIAGAMAAGVTMTPAVK